MKKSHIPFGAQFSPNQVDLPTILKIITEKAGDRSGITAAIRDSFFAHHAEAQRWKLAENTVLSLQAYGVLAKDTAQPTPIALELQDAAGAETLYERFARHILLHLRGVDFIDTLEAMRTSGEEVTLHSLRKRLEQRGLYVPRGTVHLSSLRLWLAQAGVFDCTATGGERLYEIDHRRLRAVLGVSLDQIDRLAQLNAGQRAFLRALTCITERGSLIANKVADLASTLYSVEYNHKDLPKSVLFPLRDLGYIEIQKSTAGRGAKPYQVWRTDKFYQEISEPLLAAAAEQARLVPREFFDQPLSEILSNLRAADKHVKGKALEMLILYLARLIDLEFKGWRLRSADTGGAEVDAIVEGARLIFSRWQIQAKNTDLVRLDDVAKEVGLSLTFIYSNVVMLVTTGHFTQSAHAYANHVHKMSNLNVILLDGDDLEQISHDPTTVAKVLNAKAEHAMRVKQRTDYFVGS